MDQTKIGKFIADARKKKGYTQKQLSEILNISDKTISKWETGRGFPEISLLIPLCETLDINVNELLSGERISEESYKKKAEENMMNMIKEKEENKQKMKLSVTTGIIAFVSFFTIVMTVAMYGDVIHTGVKVLLAVIACAIFAVGFYVVTQGERAIGYYRCKKCGKHFVPTIAECTMSMHIISTRYLKCPHCSEKSWCKKVMSKDE